MTALRVHPMSIFVRVHDGWKLGVRDSGPTCGGQRERVAQPGPSRLTRPATPKRSPPGISPQGHGSRGPRIEPQDSVPAPDGQLSDTRDKNDTSVSTPMADTLGRDDTVLLDRFAHLRCCPARTRSASASPSPSLVSAIVSPKEGCPAYEISSPEWEPLRSSAAPIVLHGEVGGC